MSQFEDINEKTLWILQTVRLLSHADFDGFWCHPEDCLRPFFLLPTLVEWPAPSLVSSCVFGPSTGAALGQLNLPLRRLNHRSVEFSGSVKAQRWNIARATELMEVNPVAEFWLLAGKRLAWCSEHRWMASRIEIYRSAMISQGFCSFVPSHFMPLPMRVLRWDIQMNLCNPLRQSPIWCCYRLDDASERDRRAEICMLYAQFLHTLMFRGDQQIFHACNISDMQNVSSAYSLVFPQVQVVFVPWMRLTLWHGSWPRCRRPWKVSSDSMVDSAPLTAQLGKMWLPGLPWKHRRHQFTLFEGTCSEPFWRANTYRWTRTFRWSVYPLIFIIWLYQLHCFSKSIGKEVRQSDAIRWIWKLQSFFVGFYQTNRPTQRSYSFFGGVPSLKARGSRSCFKQNVCIRSVGRSVAYSGTLSKGLRPEMVEVLLWTYCHVASCHFHVVPKHASMEKTHPFYRAYHSWLFKRINMTCRCAVVFVSLSLLRLLFSSRSPLMAIPI